MQSISRFGMLLCWPSAGRSRGLAARADDRLAWLVPARARAVTAALSRPRRSLLYVRVNAADTEFCYGDLVAIVGPGLDGIVLPKVESATALATINWLLAQLEREQDLVTGAIDLIPIFEPAGGLTNLDMILAKRAKKRWRVERIADWDAS